MADAISVLVRRGAIVEAVHRVHAVAVRDGAVVDACGDPGLVSFLRSSAKPFQALPLARAREDLDGRDLAIASASHLGRPEHVAAVEALLAKVPASPDELECGAEPTKLRHNCSGKHAGMLALCAARGWDRRGYRLAAHPVQEGCRAEVAAAAEVAPDDLPTAVDGCGVVTFALPLERMARMFSRLERLEAGEAVARAMRTHPELVRGGGATDTVLMQRLPNWTAKGGAEGLFCAAGPDGLGVALKAEDGSSRPLGPALAAFLARLDVEVPDLAVAPVSNSRGERVGEIVTKA
jgi:L-asparaginase II